MSVLTPNMSLIESTIGVDTGLSWEENLNSSLNVIDGHDHTPGHGVPITPSGININSDLSFAGFNATNLRAVRFNSQLSPISAVSPDLGELYSSGVDLYFNDGSGNQIRITQSGAVAGAPGSITGLVPPASVTYIPISTTFVFQSDTNTPANLDIGGLILRNITASSNGVTLKPATSTASYTITLPASNPTTYSTLQTNSSGTSLWQATYNAIVGSASQVSNGSANFTTLTAALAGASAGWKILILPGTYTENPTISLSGIYIEGFGRQSVITGNLSFTSATYGKLTDFQLTGNITLDSGSTGNTLDNVFVGNSLVWTDNGTGNYCRLIQG